MTLGANIVAFGVFWFISLYLVLPFRIRAQSEANDVVPGTPRSAPARHGMRWKLLAATAVATGFWLVLFLIAELGLIHLDVGFR